MADWLPIPGPSWLPALPRIIDALTPSRPQQATEQTQREYELEQLQRNPEAFWDQPISAPPTYYGQPSSPAAGPSTSPAPPSPSPPVAPPTTGSGGGSSPTPPTRQEPAPPLSGPDHPPDMLPEFGPPPTIGPIPGGYDTLPPEIFPEIYGPRSPAGSGKGWLPPRWPGDVWGSGRVPNIDGQRGPFRTPGALGELLRALERLAVRQRPRPRVRVRRPRVTIEDLAAFGIGIGIPAIFTPAPLGSGVRLPRPTPPRPEPLPIPTLPQSQTVTPAPYEIDPGSMQPAAPDPVVPQMAAPSLPQPVASAGALGAPSGFWPALGGIVAVAFLRGLRSGAPQVFGRERLPPRFPNPPPSSPPPSSPPNFPPGGLTPSNPPRVGLPSESSSRRCRCKECKPKKRGKPRKCLERAQVVWRTGRLKGRVAGSRCVRFASK